MREWQPFLNVKRHLRRPSFVKTESGKTKYGNVRASTKEDRVRRPNLITDAKIIISLYWSKSLTNSVVYLWARSLFSRDSQSRFPSSFPKKVRHQKRKWNFNCWGRRWPNPEILHLYIFKFKIVIKIVTTSSTL